MGSRLRRTVFLTMLQWKSSFEGNGLRMGGVAVLECFEAVSTLAVADPRGVLPDGALDRVAAPGTLHR